MKSITFKTNTGKAITMEYDVDFSFFNRYTAEGILKGMKDELPQVRLIILAVLDDDKRDEVLKLMSPDELKVLNLNSYPVCKTAMKILEHIFQHEVMPNLK